MVLTVDRGEWLSAGWCPDVGFGIRSRNQFGNTFPHRHGRGVPPDDHAALWMVVRELKTIARRLGPAVATEDEGSCSALTCRLRKTLAMRRPFGASHSGRRTPGRWIGPVVSAVAPEPSRPRQRPSAAQSAVLVIIAGRETRSATRRAHRSIRTRRYSRNRRRHQVPNSTRDRARCSRRLANIGTLQNR